MATKDGIERQPETAERMVSSPSVGLEPPVACVIQVNFDDTGMPYADIQDANVRPGDHVIWTTPRNDQRCFRVTMQAPIAYIGDPEPHEVNHTYLATPASGCSDVEAETPPDPGDGERVAASVRVSTVRFRIDVTTKVFYPYKITPCEGPGADAERAFTGRIIVRPPPRPK